ncbi:MAG: PD-(D/E)XK nuclease family protein [Actinomycetota bacterium]
MEELRLAVTPEKEVEETPIRLSYSSISTYELCPLQYKFRYLEGKPGRRTPALGFGESLHEALRRFHAQPVPVAPSVDTLLAYLDEAWDTAAYRSEKEERAYHAHGREVLTAYHRDNAPAFRVPVALEQRFQIDVDGVKVSGVIDRMDRHPDGSYEIVDYKTSRRLPPRRFVESDLQLSIYYLAAWEVWGILPSRLTLYFLLPGQPMTVARTPEDLDATRARIAEVAAGIRSGAFAPKENRLCDWCDYQASCPLFAHRFDREETPVDIGSAVDEWITTKRRLRADAARVEELSETIHRYCESTGLERLFGDDGAVTRYQRSEAVYHEESVRRALEPLDLLDRVTQLDAAALDALLESGLPDEVAAALREARTEQIVHALRLRDGRRR